MLGINRRALLRALRARRGKASGTIPHRHRGRRSLLVEGLEHRTLLSTFTVNSLGDTGSGSGTSGDLRYCITQADATTGDNTINFSVTGTITLNSALPDLRRCFKTLSYPSRVAQRGWRRLGTRPIHERLESARRSARNRASTAESCPAN
jgi:hypothetical protein